MIPFAVLIASHPQEEEEEEAEAVTQSTHLRRATQPLPSGALYYPPPPPLNKLPIISYIQPIYNTPENNTT